MLLQSVAHVNLWRGDSVGAIGELLRAAELSPAGADRARRLAEAAYLGETVTGDMHDVGPLLDAARRADPEHAGGLAGAVAHAYYLLNSHGDVDAAHQMLVRAIDALEDPADAHNKVLVETLHTLLQICHFGGRAQLWEPFNVALGRLTPRPPQRVVLAASTLSDPVHRALPVLGRLDAVIAEQDRETSPARIVRTGVAALYVDRLPHYRDPLWRAVQHGREGGAVTSAIEALLLLSADGWFAGTWDDVLATAAEASALCQEHGYRLLAGMSLSCPALVAAARGEHDKIRALTSQLGRTTTRAAADAARMPRPCPRCRRPRRLRGRVRERRHHHPARNPRRHPPGAMGSVRPGRGRHAHRPARHGTRLSLIHI